MKREKLLLIPNWTCKDVCDYLAIKKSKAYELMKIAREQYQGSVSTNSRVVKRDSLLLATGTTVEREVYILNLLKKGGKNEQTL